MIDIIKQIQYWQKTAEEDIINSEILLNKGRIKEGLFFCHLTIEKILKAHFVKTNKEIAPKTHNLLWLREKANLNLSDEDDDFRGELMHWQLEGRYPEYKPKIPNVFTIEKYFNKTKEMLKCLIKKL